MAAAIHEAIALIRGSIGMEVVVEAAPARSSDDFPQPEAPLLVGPLLLLIFQPITDPLSPGVVVALVADEDGAHDAVAKAALCQFNWAALAWQLMGYRGSGDLPNAQDQRVENY